MQPAPASPDDGTEAVEIDTSITFKSTGDHTAVVARLTFNNSNVALGVLNASVWHRFPEVREQWVQVMQQAAHAAVTEAARDMGGTIVASTGYRDVAP